MKFLSSVRTSSHVEGTGSNPNVCVRSDLISVVAEAGKDGPWAHIHLLPSVKHLNCLQKREKNAFAQMH